MPSEIIGGETMTNLLPAFRERFQEIQSIKSTKVRNSRLTVLMSDMEQTFGIPMIKNDNFEKQHPEIMSLYRQVSLARQF
jgi:3'-phosphoadenosine 5'-phosphosulfate sulfotransferase